MAYATYWAGAAVRVQGTFTDASGAAIDPATINLKYRPAATTTVTTWTYGGAGSIVKSSTGIYYGVLDTTGGAGTWIYEWYCPSGTGQSINVSQFYTTAPPL